MMGGMYDMKPKDKYMGTMGTARQPMEQGIMSSEGGEAEEAGGKPESNETDRDEAVEAFGNITKPAETTTDLGMSKNVPIYGDKERASVSDAGLGMSRDEGAKPN